METLGSVSVDFLDRYGRVTTAGPGAVQLSLASTNPQASLSGVVDAAATTGVASFSDLKVDRVGTGYRLVAKAAGFDSVVSEPFAITRGPASTFRFASSIQGVVGGSVLGPVLVDVTDAGGNVVTDATTPVTISASAVVGATGGGGALTGTLTKSAVAGRATFDDLSLCKAAAYTLSASAPGFSPNASNQFSIGTGPMVKLVFTSQPAGAKAGVALPVFNVAAGDSCGNPPTIPPGGSMTVAISLGANPAGATLSGTLSRGGFLAAVQFNDIVIDKAGSGYTLVATVSGPPPALTAGTSSSFVITP